ncbi:MAG: beta-glucosidase [Bacteroidales bacterium]|nr:beta-glucosidase [Bacteroidales bacterium]
MKFPLLFGLVLAFALISCRNTAQTTVQFSKLPVISDDSLLTLVEYQTFRYFWDRAEPNSGMACERVNANDIYPENDKNVITTGGSGFGFMAVLAGIERGFVSREKAMLRFEKNVEFLKKADRFHGAWPHWLNGETGKVRPFGTKDDGADLVETSYMMQGLLCVRQYYKNGNEREKKLAADIDQLWRGVEWSWFTQGGKDVIYWHWSPKYGWEMNFPVEGYNECLILYVMAASSPTYPVGADAYHLGWARNGGIMNDAEAYGYKMNLKHNGAPKYGGPLFWAHYSYLGLDPRNLEDKYANYWDHNVSQTMINYNWCVENPKKFKGYSPNCWGLTASYSHNFYAGHAPGMENDLGVITPSAAVSSLPYSPEQSMNAIRYFYHDLGSQLWGDYGFYDAFSLDDNWFPKQYLAIDQGPEIVMIENYRTGLLWKLFMSCPEVKSGLGVLGFKGFSKE